MDPRQIVNAAAHRRLGNRWRGHHSGGPDAGGSDVGIGRAAPIPDAAGGAVRRRRASLAAFGTYGVLSYAVTRRTGEMGIRMALGAAQSDVLGMVLRQGMMPVLVGLAGGAAAALRVGRYLESLLFQVSPRDPAGIRRVRRRAADRLGGGLPDSRAPRHSSQPGRRPALRIVAAIR